MEETVKPGYESALLLCAVILPLMRIAFLQTL